MTLTPAKWADTPGAIITDLRTGRAVVNTTESTYALSDAEVRAIRADSRTMKYIAIDFNITIPMVSLIKSRKRYAYVADLPEYR